MEFYFIKAVNFSFANRHLTFKSKILPRNNKRLFSTLSNNVHNYNTSLVSSSLNPWFITGFSDAEGSFVVSIYKNKNSKLGWIS